MAFRTAVGALDAANEELTKNEAVNNLMEDLRADQCPMPDTFINAVKQGMDGISSLNDFLLDDKYNCKKASTELWNEVHRTFYHTSVVMDQRWCSDKAEFEDDLVDCELSCTTLLM